MPKHNFNRCGVSHIAMLTAIVALTQPTVVFAQSETIPEGETSTTGIFVIGANAMITNNGEISTTEDFVRGILVTGAGAVINNGAISTSGTGAEGILVTGANADGILLTGAGTVIINNGAISTSDAGADGIAAGGANAMITNNGAISTSGFGADGIAATGANAMIINNGAISTSGSGAEGIAAGGANAMITNNGAISTTIDFADGIRATGAGAVITNNDAISTSGVGAEGIFADGADAVITNNGAISTSGVDTEGIVATGANAVITNSDSGAISTTGAGADGIFSTKANAVITNNGAISTSGVDAEGIVAIGANAMIINNGAISTSGAFALIASGDDAVITNNGAISTSGVDAEGIVAIGANAMIINNGAISTSGAFALIATGADAVITNSGTISTSGAFALIATGADAVITNSGTISTTGDNADGIAALGANAVITNSDSGAISTTGAGADGIFAIGADAVITISDSGAISTTGDNADGIAALGANAVIINNGAISTTGDNADGIAALGANAVITIRGSVSTSGAGAYAIRGSDDGDQTLILLSGATINGRINLGERENDADVLNIMEYTGPSLSFEGVDELVSNSAASVVRNGDIVAVIDPTGASATRVALGATMGQIHRLVSQRLAFAPALQVTQGAGVGGDRRGWGTFFGSRSERGDDGMALAWKHNFQGLVFGYDADIESGQRVGLFAGFGRDKIRTSEITSITDTATRGFVGIYGQHVTGNLTLNGALVLGRGSHNSTRTIAGSETANGKYNSTFISPSLALEWSRELDNGFELRPSVQIAYTYGSYDGYTETGTTNANVTFGKRSLNIVDSRLQLALAQPFAADRGEIEWRAGVTATHYGNNSASAQLGSGDATSYAVPGDRSLFGGFVGATLHYAIKDRVSLNSSVEYARTSGDASGLSGQLGLVFNF